jgi:hypothetical protein
LWRAGELSTERIFFLLLSQDWTPGDWVTDAPFSLLKTAAALRGVHELEIESSVHGFEHGILLMLSIFFRKSLMSCGVSIAFLP